MTVDNITCHLGKNKKNKKKKFQISLINIMSLDLFVTKCQNKSNMFVFTIIVLRNSPVLRRVPPCTDAQSGLTPKSISSPPTGAKFVYASQPNTFEIKIEI